MFASDINNKRRVVGFSATFPDAVVGFIWHGDVLEKFNAPGAEQTFLNAINHRGVIAGHAIDRLDDDSFGPHSNTGFLKVGDLLVSIVYETFNSWAYDVKTLRRRRKLLCR